MLLLPKKTGNRTLVLGTELSDPDLVLLLAYDTHYISSEQQRQTWHEVYKCMPEDRMTVHQVPCSTGEYTVVPIRHSEAFRK